MFSNAFKNPTTQYIAAATGITTVLGLWQFSTPYVWGVDGYYHIKFAYLLRTQGFLESFPWASQSLFADRFSDKEFLFHVLLIPFTYFEPLELAAKLSGVFLSSLAVFSFYCVARKNKMRAPLFWAGTLLLSASFLHRMSLTRAHVLSITMALWVLHCLLNKKRAPLAVLSFLYCWTYTAFHLPLAMGGLVFLVRGFLEKDWDVKSLWIIGLALVLGNVFHPYFPNNWPLFFIQNFQFLYGATTGALNLNYGVEIQPALTKTYLIRNTFFCFTLATVFLHAILIPTKTNRKTQMTFPIALAFLILSLISRRFLEYAIPFGTFFIGMYFTNVKPLPTLLTQRLASSGLLAMTTALALVSFNVAQKVKTDYITAPKLKAAALYLKEHANQDELVFTCDWDMTPELFFYNTKNRYQVILDPIFMYAWNPRVYTRWSYLAQGGYASDTYNILKRDFRVSYGVCHEKKNRSLKKIVENDPRMKIAYKANGYFVFWARPLS